MASPSCEERSDLPIPKRVKIEANTCDDYDSDSPKWITYDDYDSNSEQGITEEEQLFYDEWEKSQGYEIDFSKLTYCSNCEPVDLDDSSMVKEPETNRDLIAIMANEALTHYNAENNTSRKLGKMLRAMFHPGTGFTFYISFEVTDPSASDGNQTIPFRAMVGYLGRDNLTVYSCNPKPSP